MAATDNMTEATPSVRPIIENTGATATAAAETLMKTIAMDGNRINIPIDVRQVKDRRQNRTLHSKAEVSCSRKSRRGRRPHTLHLSHLLASD